MVIYMKALISTVEPRETGYRVAQVEPDENVFPVSEEMFWTDCPDDLKADEKWYDPSDNSFKDFPQPELEAQPISEGTEEV
jgi:hypothetical protein